MRRATSALSSSGLLGGVLAVVAASACSDAISGGPRVDGDRVPAKVATSASTASGAGGSDVGPGGGDAGSGGGDGGGLCVTTRATTVADRALLGAAAPYPADGTLRGRDAELAASPIARREVAWAAALRVLAPAELALPIPGAEGATLPRFHTWYTKEDVSRLFHHLYGDIGAERRAIRDPFTDQELDDAFVWNPHAIEDDPAWPEDRFAEYVASLDEEGEVLGIGGISRVAYSPGAVRHLLHSYPNIVACDGVDPPPAVTDAPTSGPRRLVHEVAELDACERRAWGPYFVGEDETLVARATGDARLEILADDGEVLCTAEPGEPCEASGARALSVAVTALFPGEVALDVDYEEADPAWTSCLDGPFPIDAAVIKADWRRVWPGDPLPTYVTSPDAIAARLAGDASWDVPDGTAEPGPESIYTVTTPAGAMYRLAGLHLMTKELDHWLWVTLFWSEDPTSDLGADRPVEIDELGGPWASYKLCAVSAFGEGDGSPSWCSNPYIEEGHGNASSNCIGCHQHGGTDMESQTILDDFPEYGRTAIRNNFPSDYSWALGQGDHLLRQLADEVEWWDAGDP